MSILVAFLVGGAICAASQCVLDLTRLTQGHTMVLFVALGAITSALGLYKPLLEFAGAGASIPLPAFGHALVQGGLEAAKREGLTGILTGGLEATAMALTVAIGFGFLMAVFFRPRG